MCFAWNVWGAQRCHGFGQSVHGKSQNFLKHNVSFIIIIIYCVNRLIQCTVGYNIFVC